MIDGYELASRLREQSSGERLHLIAVTGYGQRSDRARTAAGGFDAHLVKPLELDTLVTLLAKLSEAEPRRPEP